MTTGSKREPPEGLKKWGKTLWHAITGEYAIADSGGLSYLESACRSEDDINQFRAIVAKDGPLIRDRFNQKRPHPLLASIRDAESVKRQSLAALNLDLEPAKAPGRPPGR